MLKIAPNDSIRLVPLSILVLSPNNHHLGEARVTVFSVISLIQRHFAIFTPT